MKNAFENTIQEVFTVIKSFPKSKNWSPFLTLKNWKKLYFSIFIKKYWIDWSKTIYTHWDVLRRVRLIEFFDYFTKKFEILFVGKKKLFIESRFHRMVVLKIWKAWKERYELISFYAHK